MGILCSYHSYKIINQIEKKVNEILNVNIKELCNKALKYNFSSIQTLKYLMNIKIKREEIYTYMKILYDEYYLSCIMEKEINIQFQSNYTKIYGIDHLEKNLIIDEHSNKTHEKEIVIFDVGAHKGESAKFFRKIFQNSSIYCFVKVK